MFDLMDEYLAHAVSDDIRTIVSNAFDIFDGFQLDGYEDSFVQILSSMTDHDEHTITDRILMQVREYQEDLLRRHGITVKPEVRLSQLNVLLGALAQIPFYQSGGLILDRCTQDTVPEEAVSEIVAMVMGVSAVEVHTWFEAVSESLISTIAIWVDRSDTTVDLELIRMKELRITAYQWFIEHRDIHQLKIAYLIAHGLDVNHPAKLYLNMVGPDFNQMEADAILNEFFAIALISADYFDKPQALVTAYAEHYVANPKIVATIINTSHSLALEYAQSDIFKNANL